MQEMHFDFNILQQKMYACTNESYVNDENELAIMQVGNKMVIIVC